MVAGACIGGSAPNITSGRARRIGSHFAKSSSRVRHRGCWLSMGILPWAGVSSRRVKTCAGSIANQFSKAVDDTPVWSISCFYVRRGYRRKGVMSALIRGALKTAKRANVPAVEAYPVDPAEPGSTSNVFTGTASAFRRLGFRTIARRQPSRPIMRHDLRGIAL